MSAARPAALAALAVLAGAAGARAAEAPRIHYMLQCQGCHRADGRGAPGAVPSLVDSIGLFLGVEGGRAFLVRVPGSAQSPLDDAELAAVLNWMIREFGPAESAADFVPYGADEVARYRAEPLTDVESVRRELMERIGQAAAARAKAAAPR